MVVDCPNCPAGGLASLVSHFTRSPQCDPANRKATSSAAPVSQKATRHAVLVNKLRSSVARDISCLHLKHLIQTEHLDLFLGMAMGWMTVAFEGIGERICCGAPSATSLVQESIHNLRKTWLSSCMKSQTMINLQMQSGSLPFVEPRIIRSIPGQVASKKNVVALSARELISRMINSSDHMYQAIDSTSEKLKSGSMHRVLPEVMKDSLDGRLARFHPDAFRKARPNEKKTIRVILHGHNDDFVVCLCVVYTCIRVCCLLYACPMRGVAGWGC